MDQMQDMSPEKRSLLAPTGNRPRTASCNVDHYDHEGEKGFGDKSITWAGSFCLNLNNCMGPAMVLLPLTMQQAGWVTPCIALVVVYVLSSFAATMLCEAMQRIPGNHDFRHRYEFATTVQHYWGRRSYILFQIFYNLSMQASNVAAMIISADVVDKFFAKLGGRSYALDFEHWKFVRSTGVADYQWCEHGYMVDGVCEPEGQLKWVLSVGYLICMAICIPFGYLNLDDNMWFQWLSFAGLVGLTAAFYFIWIFKMHEDDRICAEPQGNCTFAPGASPNAYNFSHNGLDRTPAFSASLQGQAQVLGISVFAYAYVVTIPSWVNEKKPNVNVNSAIWWPATAGLFMKLMAGLFGAWAYQLVTEASDGHRVPRTNPDATDILNLLMLKDQSAFSQYAAYIWDITTLIPGIPVLAIMIRYNLLNGNVCGQFWSFFWGVVFPWIVTAFCYQQDMLNSLCNWIAIIVQGYINFVIPAMLYHDSLIRYPDNQILSVNSSSELSALLGVKDAQQDVQAVPKYIKIGTFRTEVNQVFFAKFIAIFFGILSTLSIIVAIIACVKWDQC
eukprot:m.340903 g.340903  ORF g.340903 m.340903 type:complete len:559 (+) comp19629_c0_seq1:222-1898(+)